MKAKITDSCVCCGACSHICPVGAISLAESGDRFVVDPEKCIGCGACIPNCPVEAIIAVKERGE
jgi:ferredoxin